MSNNIMDLFGKGKGQQQLPPQQQQINIDVNQLPDMPCIRCGGMIFIGITRVKKLTRTVSPTGQEGNVNVNMLRCEVPDCGWIFNPKEWEQHNKEKTVDIESTDIEIKESISVQDKVDSKKLDKELETRDLCRKCGSFFEKNTNHECSTNP